MFIRWVLGTLALCSSPLPSGAAAPDFVRDVVPTLQAHCYGCHGNTGKPKGGLNLAKFATPAEAAKAGAVWADVLASVRAGDMPPDGKPRLTAAEKQTLLAWLDATLTAPGLGGVRDPGKPTLRRLTRTEYNNTVRDLLGLSTDVFMFPERLPFQKPYFDPASGKLPEKLNVGAIEYGGKVPALLKQAGIPGDPRAEHGFTNRGDVQNFGALQFEKYVEVADQIVSAPNLVAAAPKLAPVLGASGRPAVKAALVPLLTRAFRRPPTDGVVEAYLKPYDSAKRQGANDATGVRETLRAALSSPDFLFLAEAGESRVGPVAKLGGYEVAARLSYFLWASPPDDELLAAAKAGHLSDPAGVEKQARRMLKDRRARELSETFAVQWLRLNELWAAQPDKSFKSFYAGPQGKGTLHADLMAEALLLFETVLIEDRSVMDFVAADYGYVNPRLAAHYGLAKEFEPAFVAAGAGVKPGLTGHELQHAQAAHNATWVRVKWPDQSRGGFLTCGAVLTVTSLPQRTSPVKRGAWVLESVFNRPPPEPTVAVEPLDSKPASATGKTVRQKLEAHRKDPNCSGCHAKIDPPGFALEAFDPVGRLRTTDDKLPIDARGTLPDGRTFDGPTQFKATILADKPAFAKAFAGHLLSYALGRKLEHFDEPALNEIAAAAAQDGYRFSRFVTGVVTSYPFRHTRTTPPESAK